MPPPYDFGTGVKPLADDRERVRVDPHHAALIALAVANQDRSAVKVNVANV